VVVTALILAACTIAISRRGNSARAGTTSSLAAKGRDQTRQRRLSSVFTEASIVSSSSAVADQLHRSTRTKTCFARLGAAVLAAGLAVAVPAAPTAAETDCKSWLFGICTGSYTLAEQAEINSRKWLEALLRDPARAAPELEKRLRRWVRYSNGLLLIEDPILHGITTLPATAGWSIDCDTSMVEVTFASTLVNLVPWGTNIQKSACPKISDLLGQAVLRLTGGQ
jgi:hypothetical protein